MRINKKKIISVFRPRLETLGYIYLEDNFTLANGLFYKIIGDNFILMVGFTISSIQSKYTADFYLSKVFEFGYMLKDFPRDAYIRIASLLTNDERERLLKDIGWGEKGMTDAWWSNLDEKSISNFMNVLILTEGRFLNQAHLFDLINQSERLNRFLSFIKKIQEDLSKQHTQNEVHYAFLPNKLENIPIEWYKSAETVLKKDAPAQLNKDYVKLLGVNAWRYFNLL